MKNLISIVLLAVLVIILGSMIFSVPEVIMKDEYYYKAVNLEQSKIEIISQHNPKTLYNTGDSVWVDSNNYINNIDSNTMQYLIIKQIP